MPLLHWWLTAFAFQHSVTLTPAKQELHYFFFQLLGSWSERNWFGNTHVALHGSKYLEVPGIHLRSNQLKKKTKVETNKGDSEMTCSNHFQNHYQQNSSEFCNGEQTWIFKFLETSRQAFWQDAWVRDRTIRSKPHNPAQFLKIHEIPHNMEIFG